MRVEQSLLNTFTTSHQLLKVQDMILTILIAYPLEQKIPGNFIIGIINWFRNFLDLEIRQLPEYLLALVAMVLAIPFYFISFPIIALVLYRKLKKTTYNYSRNHILMVLNHYETK